MRSRSWMTPDTRAGAYVCICMLGGLAVGCPLETAVPQDIGAAGQGMGGAGQGAPSAEVVSTEAPLLAGVEFADTGGVCDEDDQLVIRNAMLLGRAAALSDAFAECINDRIDDDEHRSCVTTDPWFGKSKSTRVAKVLEAARSELPALIDCNSSFGTDTCSTVLGEELPLPNPYQVPGKKPLKPNGFQDSSCTGLGEGHADGVRSGDAFEVQFVAGLLSHEAMHTLGYADSRTCGTGVPKLVERCISEVVSFSAAFCNEASDCARGARLGTVAAHESGGTSGPCQCIRDPGEFSDPDLDAPSAPVLDVNELDDRYGTAVVMGDFNGDGMDDAAVGAPGEDAGAGAVYLYEGTVVGLYPKDVLVQGELGNPEAGDEFGYALTSADFDEDGYDDLAVGSPGENHDEGRVFLYRGSVDGLKAVRVLSQAGLGANEANDRFGHALVARWHDTRWGLVVGAPGEWVQHNTVQSGHVFVFDRDFTNPANLLEPAFGFNQSGVDKNETGDSFGWSLAVGRIDNDDVNDVVVGAPGEDGGVGKAYVFLTRSGRTSGFSDLVALEPPAFNSRFGHSVAVGRYLSGSRKVAIGAPFAGFAQGGAHIYSAQTGAGAPTGQDRLLFSFYGDVVGALAGFSLTTYRPDSSASCDSLAVGAPGSWIEEPGRVYLLDGGGANGTLTHAQTLNQRKLGQDEFEDAFGLSVASGRIGADGSDDLLVGGPGEARASEPAAGAVYLFRRDAGEAEFVPWKYHTQGD